MSESASINRITRYGSVKRRLVFDDDNTPAKIKSQGFDTPVKRTTKILPQIVDSTPKGKIIETAKTLCITPPKTLFTPKTIEQFCTPVTENGKYSRLISPVKKANLYILPKKYQQLYDTFESMDRIVSLSKIHSKRIVYEDLERDIKRKIKKDFTMTTLAKIIGTYPNSYNLRIEEHRTFGMKTPGKLHDLVIEPNLKNDLESYWRPESPKKYPSVPQFGTPVKLRHVTRSPRKQSDYIPLSPRKTPTKTLPQMRPLKTVVGERMEAWRLACRRAIFKYKLYQIVQSHHKEFLEKICEKVENIEEGEYHKDFNLETIPDPISGELPEPPKIPKQKSMKEYVTPEIKIPKEVTKTIECFKSPEKLNYSSNGKVPLSPKKFKGDTPKLSLYERIMLKQKARDAENDSVKLANKKRKNQLDMLYTEMLYSIWSAFTRIKPKISYRLLELKHRIGNDCKSLNGNEIVEHLELLCEIAPKYFDIYNAGLHGHKFLRRTIDSEDDYQLIKNIISNEIEKIKL